MLYYNCAAWLKKVEKDAKPYRDCGKLCINFISHKTLYKIFRNIIWKYLEIISQKNEYSPKIRLQLVKSSVSTTYKRRIKKIRALLYTSNLIKDINPRRLQTI